MPWPRKCAVCGSLDIQAGADNVQCMNCSRLTDANGVAVPLEVQYSREDQR